MTSARRRFVAAAALVTAAVTAVPAFAHVQVSPQLVAPADPVVFTLLVPNERDVPTVAVELQIPDGVLPFAFEETPGWERSERLAADQSLDVVEWTGSLPPGGFVRFSFLASTPDAPGEISWPAVQTYADGEKARWIGPPDSEEPAAVTRVSADAPRQNAGGEGNGSSSPPGETAPAAVTEASAQAGSSDDGAGWPGWIAIVSLVLAAVALAVALRGAFARRGG